jgi:hypothetical protein
MTNDIQVVANYKASSMGGMEIVQVYLKTDLGEITLSKKQWDEIKTTMAGNRKSGFSEDFDGYTPHTAAFWN